jgi:Domain of unknown function (DUF4042)
MYGTGKSVRNTGNSTECSFLIYIIQQTQFFFPADFLTHSVQFLALAQHQERAASYTALSTALAISLHSLHMKLVDRIVEPLGRFFYINLQFCSGSVFGKALNMDSSDRRYFFSASWIWIFHDTKLFINSTDICTVPVKVTSSLIFSYVLSDTQCASIRIRIEKISELAKLYRKVGTFLIPLHYLF